MSLKNWLIEPYADNLKQPTDVGLTLRVLKGALKWSFLAFGKYRIKPLGKKSIYPEYARDFCHDGVFKHHIGTEKLSESFMKYISLGVEDLVVRKSEEIARSGKNRSFESTLFSLSQEGIEAFETCEFGIELRRVVHDIVGTRPKLRNIQLHVNMPGETFAVFSQGNDAIPTSKHFGYHADNNINTIKAMAYLEFANGDGAFEYLRGSQKMTNLFSFSLKKANRHLGLARNTEEAVKRMMSLPHFLRAKSEISAFSSTTKLASMLRDNDCNIGAQNGDVVIFDPIGLHKGGLVEKNRRIALQIVYSPEEHLWAI